jgi:hypothetical protein
MLTITLWEPTEHTETEAGAAIQDAGTQGSFSSSQRGDQRVGQPARDHRQSPVSLVLLPSATPSTTTLPGYRWNTYRWNTYRWKASNGDGAQTAALWDDFSMAASSVAVDIKRTLPDAEHPRHGPRYPGSPSAAGTCHVPVMTVRRRLRADIKGDR